MDNTCSNNKGLTVGARAKNHLKKAHRISNKTLVVIDETLIQELAIDDENTWFEQLRTEDGILLKIQRTRGD
jgi:hypothetical protein